MLEKLNEVQMKSLERTQEHAQARKRKVDEMKKEQDDLSLSDEDSPSKPECLFDDDSDDSED